ncbi:membrane protein [[Actinobacillus] muris]|uniref:Membrane protein n=1 Tax=Muribacter muris TaxID=67855 RepID=A0A0J5P6Y5_9PAST|nr:DUF4198 domain-containing protein [Muribacter muris]KMK52016.1 membrane protein [[Actinobacillus] muris] [Muribacter muris]
MTFKQLPLFFLPLFSSSLAFAHNVWLEPAPDNRSEYVIKFGHEETFGYPQAKLKAVKKLTANGNIEDIPYHFKQEHAFFEAQDADIVFIRFDNGVWSKLPNGRYVEKSKSEEPTAVLSMNPVKFGKSILKWTERATQPHQMEYELVPLSRPQAGQPLDILVLHKGQPVPNIKVGLGEDKPFNLTNAQGIARFEPTKGNNKVWAEFSENIENNPNYTQRSIEYMLTFEAE